MGRFEGRCVFFYSIFPPLGLRCVDSMHDILIKLRFDISSKLLHKIVFRGGG